MSILYLVASSTVTCFLLMTCMAGRHLCHHGLTGVNMSTKIFGEVDFLIENPLKDYWGGGRVIFIDLGPLVLLLWA